MPRREHTIVRDPDDGPDAAPGFAAFQVVVRLAAAARHG
jgi:hypothetical protein